MDQYLNVDQWQKKPEKEPKKEESTKEEEPKRRIKEYEWLNQLAAK